MGTTDSNTTNAFQERRHHYPRVIHFHSPLDRLLILSSGVDFSKQVYYGYKVPRTKSLHIKTFLVTLLGPIDDK